MVKPAKIYTHGGDKGMTSLAGGERRPKYDLRIEACGTVDETSAAVGLTRLHTKGDADAMLAHIQQDLFALRADLSTPMLPRFSKALRIVPIQVKRLEREMDRMNAELSPPALFVLPGGKKSSAHLHLARTVCRRAERLVCELSSMEVINNVALQYLNRLSDHFFVMARFLNAKGKKDVLWTPGAGRVARPKSPKSLK
jgi:cob(I)alamin adenosyltransferase